MQVSEIEEEPEIEMSEKEKKELKAAMYERALRDPTQKHF